jgi:hypothetical protein
MCMQNFISLSSISSLLTLSRLKSQLQMLFAAILFLSIAPKDGRAETDFFINKSEFCIDSPSKFGAVIGLGIVIGTSVGSPYIEKNFKVVDNSENFVVHLCINFLLLKNVDNKPGNPNYILAVRCDKAAEYVVVGAYIVFSASYKELDVPAWSLEKQKKHAAYDRIFVRASQGKISILSERLDLNDGFRTFIISSCFVSGLRCWSSEEAVLKFI